MPLAFIAAVEFVVVYHRPTPLPGGLLKEVALVSAICAAYLVMALGSLWEVGEWVYEEASPRAVLFFGIPLLVVPVRLVLRARWHLTLWIAANGPPSLFSWVERAYVIPSSIDADNALSRLATAWHASFAERSWRSWSTQRTLVTFSAPVWLLVALVILDAVWLLGYLL